MNKERWVSTVGFSETLQEKLKRRRAYLTRKYNAEETNVHGNLNSLLKPIMNLSKRDRSTSTSRSPDVLRSEENIIVLDDTQSHQSNDVETITKTFKPKLQQLIEQNKEITIVQRFASDTNNSNRSIRSSEISSKKLVELTRNDAKNSQVSQLEPIKNNAFQINIDKAAILNKTPTKPEVTIVRIMPKLAQKHKKVFSCVESSSSPDASEMGKQIKRRRKRQSTQRITIHKSPSSDEANISKGKQFNIKKMDSVLTKVDDTKDDEKSEITLNQRKIERIKYLFDEV